MSTSFSVKYNIFQFQYFKIVLITVHVKPSSTSKHELFAKKKAIKPAPVMENVFSVRTPYVIWLVVLQERSVLLRKWFELMTLHKEDLAKLITFESVSIKQRQNANSWCKVGGFIDFKSLMYHIFINVYAWGCATFPDTFVLLHNIYINFFQIVQ